MIIMRDKGIIERKESWGKLSYDTINHRFNIKQNVPIDSLPYVENRPVVLNIDLTLKCNMNCIHCVAKDMEREINEDLVITKDLLDWVNNSDFMVIVVTGGEPLLLEKEDDLIHLISKIKNKGIIIDTNGIIFPGKKVINAMLKKNVLLRVSLDSPTYDDESFFRRITSLRKTSTNEEAYFKKLKNLVLFNKRGIKLAAQSVLSTKNYLSIDKVPELLVKYKIKYWHIQKFILSNKAKDEKYSLDDERYRGMLKKLTEKCNKMGIDCFGKMEKRHNSVFLLVGNGEIYTQGEKPGQKIRLGNIDSEIKYFDYVSSSEHSVRYYGSYWAFNYEKDNIKFNGMRR